MGIEARSGLWVRPDHWSQPPSPEDLRPFRLGSGRTGVLLIHGFCGTPPEVRGLGEHLAARGMRVHGALLMGHGTTPEDLELTTWQEWVDSAQRQLDTLRAECDTVALAGQSMGGTIALLLAARNPWVTSVATCAALLRLPGRTETLIRVGRLVRRWHYPDPKDVDLWEPEGALLLRSYNRRAMRSHVELLRLMAATRAELPRLQAPALVLHGLRDRTVPPANAELVRSLAHGRVEVKYFQRSGHGMTVDVDRQEIFNLIGDHLLAAARRSQLPVAAEV